MNALEIIGLTKRLAAKPVLQHVDLRVGEGEIVGLIGLNGAGKSSLLRCVVDLLQIDSGRLLVFARSHRDPASRMRMGYLPERFSPSRHLHGRDFLRFMLALDRRSYHARAVESVLDGLQLPLKVLQTSLHRLSKGTVQRLGLAACLLADKRLYLLDEPASGLDVVARSLLRQQLRRLREDGRSVLLTTHLLADAAQLCDRVCVLHAGRICRDAANETPLQATASPALEAAFLDSIKRAELPVARLP